MVKNCWECDYFDYCSAKPFDKPSEKCFESQMIGTGWLSEKME